MKIAIIGAGSIGLLFASYLSRAFTITLYTKTIEQAEKINQKGIICQNGTTHSNASVKAIPLLSWAGKEELTIIAVKQYHLHAILDKLHSFDSLPENLLFLQNGMSHLKLLENLHDTNIFVGSVEHGASKINSYTVQHNGEGAINVALFKGDARCIEKITEGCTRIHFPLTIKMDYYNMLVKKLIANAVINPLTAILQVKNGELISNIFYFAAVKKLFLEVTWILNLEDPIRKFRGLIRICKKTADNRSSMLKDLESGRRTEIEAILGYLLDEAAKQKKKAVNIEGYYFLIKGKEHDRGRVN